CGQGAGRAGYADPMRLSPVPFEGEDVLIGGQAADHGGGFEEIPALGDVGRGDVLYRLSVGQAVDIVESGLPIWWRCRSDRDCGARRCLWNLRWSQVVRRCGGL